MNQIRFVNLSFSLATIALAAATVMNIGCAQIQSVSMTSIPANRSKPVRVEASKTIFLGFNFSNDFVDQLSTDLQKQCVGGQIKGILTKDETVNYFLYIVWKHRVTASGYCLKGDVASLAFKGDAQ